MEGAWDSGQEGPSSPDLRTAMRCLERRASADRFVLEAHVPGKKGKGKRENRIVAYLKDTQAEIRKVHWPSRKEARNLTSVVLAVMVVMSIFLSGVDYLFSWVASLLVG